MRTRTRLVVFVIVGILFSAVMGKSQEAGRRLGNAEDAKSEIDMRKKLEYSKIILDGLVTEDFDKILEGAKALNQLAKQKWIKNDSVAYRTQNQVFWFTTGTLVMAAENKNIDEATLSYTQMMHSCVNCHKIIRRQ